MGRKVSIPIGFSSSLQHHSRWFAFQRHIGFQSLSGFQVRCNLKEQGFIEALNKPFQSLSGFQVRCNFMMGMMDEMI